jgi:hypothetical protein
MAKSFWRSFLQFLRDEASGSDPGFPPEIENRAPPDEEQ